MSSTENFQLNWSGFTENASLSFKDLLTDTNFLDVTLASSDHNQIKAHKLILSASSVVFKELLSKNIHQHPLIFMKGVNIEHLNSLVKFIYLGQVEICQDKLDNFLEIAEDFKVKGLFRLPLKETAKEETVDESIAVHQNDVSKHNEHNELSKENEDYLFNQEDLGIFNSMTQESSGLVGFQQDTFDTLSVMDIDVANIDFNAMSSLADIKEELNEEIYQKQSQKDIHVYPSDYVFECDKCNYKAKKNSNLKRHKLAKHEGVSFPCPFCNFPFKYKADLSRHIRTLHEGLKRSQVQQISNNISPSVGLTETFNHFSNNLSHQETLTQFSNTVSSPQM